MRLMSEPTRELTQAQALRMAQQIFDFDERDDWRVEEWIPKAAAIIWQSARSAPFAAGERWIRLTQTASAEPQPKVICRLCRKPEIFHIPDAGKLACPTQSMDESVPIQYFQSSAEPCIKADTLFGIYCNGNPMNVPKDVEVYWEGWQRVAGYVNRPESAERTPGMSAEQFWPEWTKTNPLLGYMENQMEIAYRFAEAYCAQETARLKAELEKFKKAGCEWMEERGQLELRLEKAEAVQRKNTSE